MIKKILILVFMCSMLFIISFSACASSTKLEAKKVEITNNDKNVKSDSKSEKDVKVDIDLSKLKGNMLYSQLTNIIEDYEQYIGKTIR